MKLPTSTLLLTAATTLLASTSAFVVPPPTLYKTGVTLQSQTASLNMGLLDFFSPEEKAKRDAKKKKEIEEQEKLQKAIMERRKNPDLMEEYEQKTAMRRQLKMKGDFEAAESVDVFEGVVEKQTLLDGTSGSAPSDAAAAAAPAVEE